MGTSSFVSERRRPEGPSTAGAQRELNRNKCTSGSNESYVSWSTRGQLTNKVLPLSPRSDCLSSGVGDGLGRDQLPSEESGERVWGAEGTREATPRPVPTAPVKGTRLLWWQPLKNKKPFRLRVSLADLAGCTCTSLPGKGRLPPQGKTVRVREEMRLCSLTGPFSLTAESRGQSLPIVPSHRVKDKGGRAAVAAPEELEASCLL